MRILSTCVGGLGHYVPLAPLARAALAAGHDVAFACSPGLAAHVEAAGFTAFPLGTARGGAPERLPLRPVDREREERELRERFAERAATARVPLVSALCESWLPDVLVCDETDFGAIVAAERLALPHATLLVLAAGSFARREVVGEALDDLRAANGLPPDPELEMLHRHLVLSPFPPRFRDPADPLPPTAHSFRPPMSRSGRGTAPHGTEPKPWSEPSPMPCVYFTLGTIFNVESGDLLMRVVSALRELPLRLVVSVGPDLDPAELGPQPAHVHLERFVPQGLVLPYCDAVVSHGGSGSVMGALAHGLPSVLLPLGADQPLNADRCAELGVAVVLDVMRATADELRTAVTRALEDTALRANAERLQREIEALPELASAVALIERLGTERRPILRA